MSGVKEPTVQKMYMDVSERSLVRFNQKSMKYTNEYLEAWKWQLLHQMSIF